MMEQAVGTLADLKLAAVAHMCEGMDLKQRRARSASPRTAMLDKIARKCSRWRGEGLQFSKTRGWRAGEAATDSV